MGWGVLVSDLLDVLPDYAKRKLGTYHGHAVQYFEVDQDLRAVHIVCQCGHGGWLSYTQLRSLNEGDWDDKRVARIVKEEL